VRDLKVKLGCQYVNGFGMCEGPLTQTRLDDPDDVIETTIGIRCSPYDDIKVMNEKGKILPPGKDGNWSPKVPGFSRVSESRSRKCQGFHPFGLFPHRRHGQDRQEWQRRHHRKDQRHHYPGRGKYQCSGSGRGSCPPPGCRAGFSRRMPDKEMGEKVCAYIRTKGGKTLTLDQVVQFLKQNRVSVLNIPERIEHIDVFPLTKAKRSTKRFSGGDQEEIAGGRKTVRISTPIEPPTGGKRGWKE